MYASVRSLLSVAVVAVVGLGPACERTSSAPSPPVSESAPQTIEFCGNSVALDAIKVECHDRTVVSVEPLRSLFRVEEVFLDGTGVADLEPLAACETITSIAIRNTRVVDVSVLRALPNLQTLDAEGAPIELDTVAGLTQIRMLEISPISQNLDPLSDLELFDLTINSDTVTDIEALSGKMIALLTLDLPLLRDASALADMEVHFLDLVVPRLVDVRPLLEIEGLTRLRLFTAADLEPLAVGCESKMFEYLYISSPRGSVSAETRYSLARCAEIFVFGEY